MIVLDTNVISELFKFSPAPQVMNWLHQQTDVAVFTTAITRGEMLFGLNILPNGQRKAALIAGLLGIFEVRFPSRVLAYDSEAADAHAALAAERRANGQPISQADAMIAGIVRSRSAQLATRNVRDFEGCGITVVDPWH